MRPGRTALAKPRPTPSMTAVPQSGPMTSAPREAAYVLRATSSATGTLSLKTITSWPASRASIASTVALAPGHGDERDRAGTRTPQRGARRARRGDGGVARRRPGRRERGVDGGQRGRDVGVVVEAERDDHVVGGGLGDVEAHALEHLEVEAGGHRHLGGDHAGRGLHGPAHLEQGHRVGVGAAPELDVVLHAALQGLSWSVVEGRQGEAGAGEEAGSRRGARRPAGPRWWWRWGRPATRRAAGSTSPRIAQSSRVAESRVVAPRRRRTAAVTAGSGRPSAARVASQPASTSSPSGVRPGPRPDEPVDVGCRHSAVGGELEAGRHGAPSSAGSWVARRATVVARGSTTRPIRTGSSPTRSVPSWTVTGRPASGARSGKVDQSAHGHAGRGGRDQPEAPAVEVDVERRGARVQDRPGPSRPRRRAATARGAVQPRGSFPRR